MNWKKWISIAAAVCLAVTAVPMRAVAQEELVQEKMLEELKRQGFDGGVILEVYRDNYQVYEELGESYQKILEAISEKAL